MGDEGYCLVRQRLREGLYMLVLAKSGDRATFVDSLVDNPRTRHEAICLWDVMTRVARYGTRWGLESRTLKPVRGTHGRVVCYELKDKATVYRIMTYLHDDPARTPVLLFAFHGHKSKKAGGIREEDIKKAMGLVPVARQLMEEELG